MKMTAKTTGVKKTPFFDRTMTRKQFLLFSYVPMAVVTGLLIMAGLYFREYYKSVLEDPAVIRHHIVDAVENLSSEAPVVPDNADQYIPEMKLRFDRSKAKLMYLYSSKTDEAGEYAIVTSSVIKNESSTRMYSYQNFTNLFNGVPEYQRCQRPFILTTEDKPPLYFGDYQKLELLELGSRKLYIWKTSEHLCAAADGINFEDLLNTIKSAEAY